MRIITELERQKAQLQILIEHTAKEIIKDIDDLAKDKLMIYLTKMQGQLEIVEILLAKFRQEIKAQARA